MRVNQFLMPFWTFGAAADAVPELERHAWVPIDDHHTWHFMFSYTPDQPFREVAQAVQGGYWGRETSHHSHSALRPGR